MSMKKKALVAASCVMVAAMAIGGTVAYLTDRDNATNTFTVGNVDIELKEEFEQGAELLPGDKLNKDVSIVNTGSNDAWVFYSYAIPAAMNSISSASDNVIHVNYPGNTWDKYRENKNYWADNQNAALPIEETWNQEYAVEEGVMIDGVEYVVYVGLYNGKLTPGTETSLAMTQVYLDTNVDVAPNGDMYHVEKGVATDLNWNIYADGAPKIYVNGYAIQAKGFDTAEDAYDAYIGQWGKLNGIYEDDAVAEKIATDAETLNSVLEADKAVAMGADVATDTNILLKGGTFNGCGNTLDGTNYETNGKRTDCVITTTGGTIKSVTISGGFRGVGSGSSGTYSLEEDLYVEGVTITGTTYGFNIGGGNEHKLFIENSSICDWNSYDGLSEANFTNCTFTSEGSYYCTQRISANATFTYTDCNFEQNTYSADQYFLESYDGTGTIVFKNCYMGGTLITSENVWDLFDPNEEKPVAVVVNNG